MITTIYTDGSCRNKRGGYAYVIITDMYDIYWSDSVKEDTTNNRMELKAVIEALKTLKQAHCMIYSDSQWVINCALRKWKRNKNLDLWKEYEVVSSQQKVVDFQWVKGHSNDKYNEICDKLAFKEMNDVSLL